MRPVCIGRHGIVPIGQRLPARVMPSENLGRRHQERQDGISAEARQQHIQKFGGHSADRDVARLWAPSGQSKESTVAALGPPTRAMNANDSGSGRPWNRQQHFLTYEYELDGRKRRVYFGDDGRVLGLWMPLDHGSLD